MMGQIPHKERKKQGDYRWNHYDSIEQRKMRQELKDLIKLKEQAMEE